jgi:polysaccharide chain length determinant protein (PEP-CTERM system associated)
MRKLQHNINLIKVHASGIWGKKRYVLLPMIVVCSLGWSTVSTMPNQYETKARVYADTTNILKPLLNGIAVQEDTQSEVKITARTLLSREVREDIAQRSDLHLLHAEPDSFNAIIDSLESDIKITSSKATDVYDISYRHPNATIAMNVVSLTMQAFIDASTGKSREDTQSATSFLIGRIKEQEAILKTSERQLAEFKKNNKGNLPSQEGNYYAQLSATQNELERTVQDIITEKAQVEGLRARFVPRTSNGTLADGEVVVETQYDARLALMQETLDGLRIRYTDKHPNIQELLANIENVKALQLKAQDHILEQASRGALTASNSASGAALQEFSYKISDLSAQRDRKVSKANLLREKLKELESKLETIPEVEAQLIGLTRNYENTNKLYQELLTRKSSAELSRSADEDTQAVKFKILEEARISVKPVGPPRIVFFTVILILSFFIGVACAFLASQVSPVVNGSTHLQMLIGKSKIIGQIENTEGAELRKKNRIKALIFFATLTSFVMVYMGLVAHEIIFGQSISMWL